MPPITFTEKDIHPLMFRPLVITTTDSLTLLFGKWTGSVHDAREGEDAVPL